MSSPTVTDTYTVAVFKDHAWAARGLEALARQGFPPDALSIIARETPAAGQLIAQVMGRAADHFDVAYIGTCTGAGTLVSLLQGSGSDLGEHGLSGTLNRAAFQAHDARIFEKLTERGGVLVAVRTEPRAADALAVFHSYGGANAAIGAWKGRV